MIQAERKGFYRDLAIVYHNLPGGDTVSQPETQVVLLTIIF